ncbi:transmembrane protein 41A-B-like, partial [Engraulis encrasicolus]
MRSILGLVVLVVSATLYLYLLTAFLPPGPRHERRDEEGKTIANEFGEVEMEEDRIHFPSDLEELRDLAALLNFYKNEHKAYVILLFCSAYLYKQSFAIPGSSFLNMLAGAIFGTRDGLLIACAMSTIGSTFCYLLSHNFGKKHVVRLFPDKVAMLQKL